MHFLNNIYNFRSNIAEEKKLQFELVQGQTEQTNKWHTFVLEPEADSAYIKLGNHLDYEKITDYTLTVRIQVWSIAFNEILNLKEPKKSDPVVEWLSARETH